MPLSAALAAAGLAAASGLLLLAPPRRTGRPSARALAWRNRLLSAALAASLLAGARAWTPHPAARMELAYLVVTTLGYGHLLGAAGVGRRRERRARTSARQALRLAFGATGVLSLLAAYALALERWPLLLAAPLALSLWHALENDLALEGAYAAGGRPGPLPRAAGPPLLALGLCALLLPAAPGAGRLVEVGDLLAAAILYHLVSWLVLLADGARRPGGPAGEGARLARRLVRSHLPPALLCAALVAGPEGLAPLRAAVFSPALYLFWSALHVVQTAAARGLAPRGAATRGGPGARAAAGRSSRP